MSPLRLDVWLSKVCLVRSRSQAKAGCHSGKILLVYFGGASRRRLTGRMHPSRLGVGLYTHATRDLQALRRRLSEQGASIEVEPQDVDGQPTMLVRGPNEELFEFVEQRGLELV